MKMRATWYTATMKNDRAYFHLESFASFSFQEEKGEPARLEGINKLEYLLAEVLEKKSKCPPRLCYAEAL